MPREAVVRELEALGCVFFPGFFAPDQVLSEMLELNRTRGPFSRPVVFYPKAGLLAAPLLSAGCEIIGVITTPCELGEGVYLGMLGFISQSQTRVRIGAHAQILGTVWGECSVGERAVVGQGVLLRNSSLGARSVVGGTFQSSAENALIVDSEIGEDCVVGGSMQHSRCGSGNKLSGQFYRCSFGQDNLVSNSVLSECQVGDSCQVEDHAHLEHSTLAEQVCVVRSRVEHSTLGSGSEVLADSFIERSALMPYYEPLPTGEKRHVVSVLRGRVSYSLVWGGSKIMDGAVVRGHSVLGPFVYLGPGSETKAALLRGASPTASIEIPHRSYLGNALGSTFRSSGEQPLFLDPANAALTLRLPFTHRPGSTKLEVLVAGGFHLPEVTQWQRDEQTLSVPAEGINVGALFTTSNFDARAGGSKWPTLLGGGLKLGVSSVAQAPVYLPEGGLLASSAKSASAKAYEANSLILGGAGAARVMPGFMDSLENLLGSGVRDKIELTFTYLHNLEALILAQAETPEPLDPRHAPGLAVEQNHLSLQLNEVLGSLRRYIELVPVVFEKLRELALATPEFGQSRSYQELATLQDEIETYRQMAARFRGVS